MDKDLILPVILCGGTGTRLWPLSRKSFPKQYLSINSKENISLLQTTQKRVTAIEKTNEPIIICNEEHRFLVAEQMREINVRPKKILLEPFGRNTAPAITLSILKALEIEQNPLMLVLSSDHQINDEKTFSKIINEGVQYANQGKIVVFGTTPTAPETGYGYIKAQKPFVNNEKKGYKIEKYIEKPNLETAKKLVKDKKYLWNSGIFLFRAKDMLNEIKRYAPNILENCEKAINVDLVDLDFERIDSEYFKKCDDISLDVAIMEKTNLGIVLPLDVGWSDIGNWNSVWKVSDKDENGNFMKGNVHLQDSKNCYIRSENKLISGFGISNLIVIQSDDATLIIDQNKAEKVKDIVNDLSSRKIKEGKVHKKVF